MFITVAFGLKPKKRLLVQPTMGYRQSERFERTAAGR